MLEKVWEKCGKTLKMHLVAKMSMLEKKVFQHFFQHLWKIDQPKYFCFVENWIIRPTEVFSYVGKLFDYSLTTQGYWGLDNVL